VPTAASDWNLDSDLMAWQLNRHAEPLMNSYMPDTATSADDFTTAAVSTSLTCASRVAQRSAPDGTASDTKIRKKPAFTACSNEGLEPARIEFGVSPPARLSVPPGRPNSVAPQ